MYRPSWIKSVQRGITTMAAAATSATATITAVDVTRAYVKFLGSRCDASSGTSESGLANVTLTNSTTVTVARIGSAGNTSVSWVVIERYQGVIKSLQDVAPAMVATLAQTQTITAVNVLKAFLAFRGQTITAGAPEVSSFSGTLSITNSTTVTADRAGSAATMTLYGTVVEEK